MPTLPKYRLSLKEKKSGVFAAAATALEAAQLCFPDHKISQVSEGYRWVQFKVEPPIDLKWPNDRLPKDPKGKTTCSVLDVELHGEILIP